MNLENFKKLKQGELLTIRKKGKIIDIFHYSKIYELHHHCYNNEDFYYLNMVLQPKIEDISKTTKKDIDEYYKLKKEIFNEKLQNILKLKKEII